jgi:hypothetical protein
MSFLSGMTEEIGARRRRLRRSLGDRTQAILEALVLGGLVAGSLGLLLEPWMLAAAPWGLALPFIFVVGFVLLEARRQRALARYRERLPELQAELDEEELQALLLKMRKEDPTFHPDDEAKARAAFESQTEERRQARSDNAALAVAPSYDWAVLLWAFGCALAGAAAFIIAWTARPPEPAPDHSWEPPRGTVNSDIGRP